MRYEVGKIGMIGAINSKDCQLASDIRCCLRSLADGMGSDVLLISYHSSVRGISGF